MIMIQRRKFILTISVFLTNNHGLQNTISHSWCCPCFLTVRHNLPFLQESNKCRASTRQYHTTINRNLSREDLSLAEDVFARIAKRGKSWKRLRHLIDLATTTTATQSDNKKIIINEEKKYELIFPRGTRNIVDVGTDHGLLAIGLAVSGQFDKVLGVDISKKALQDGAFTLQKKMMKKCNNNNNNELFFNKKNLEFRYSDGLKHVQYGEADIVCIAGMGYNTMLEILTATTTTTTGKKLYNNSSTEYYYILDYLNCQRLILQMTNGKPRHLTYLYDKLYYDMGWVVKDEKIEYISKRWYISSLFERRRHDNNNNQNSKILLPGEILLSTLNNNNNNNTEMYDIFLQWLDHHKTWIINDKKVAGSIPDEEQRWLNVMFPDCKD